MPFEVDAELQELLWIRLPPGHEGARDEAERDGRGTRAEPALARDPVGEGEREPVGGMKAREGQEREVVRRSLC